MSDISTFLKSIKELNTETVSVFLPSKSNNVDLVALNLKQQKDIISCVADGITGLVSFNRILNNIIISASGLNDLSVVDRVPAIIGLRIKAHGSTYNTDEGSIDLSEITKRLPSYKVDLSDKVLEYNGIKATVCVPKLSQENNIISKLEDEVRKNNDDNTKNIGSIYIYEIIKFVKSLEYDSIVIDFNSISIKERINVLESLPLTLNKQIIDYIEEIKRQEKDLLTVDGVTVDITPGFFNAE